MQRKRRTLAIFVAALVLIGVAGWFAFIHLNGRYRQQTNDAAIRADAVIIASKLSGYVAEVLVVENQDVRAGQPLVRIDPRSYETQALLARAQVEQADAALTSAMAALQEQEAAIQQAKAVLTSVEEKADQAKREVSRYAPLVASGAESAVLLTQRRSEFQQAAANVRAQTSAVRLQENRLNSLHARIEEARAQGQSAKAQYRAADIDLRSVLLRAPFAGRVGNATVALGQFAQPGMRLMSIVPMDRIYVIANFKETQLALVRIGQPAEIEIDAFGSLKIPGRVASIAPGTGAQFSLLPPQNATGNFTKIVQRVPVRISLNVAPEVARLLVPGLSVTATVDTSSARSELRRLEQHQKLRGTQVR